jgi:cobalt-zinc-cadmium efflux system outer membrane protein
VTIDVLAAAVEVGRARLAAHFAAEQRELAERLVEVSAGRARQGVGAPLDVELAEAARVQAHREELSAGRAWTEAGARLALAVGAEISLAEGPPVAVAGPDQPVAELVVLATERRLLVRQARAESEAGSSRLELLRRERIPDVTIGASLRHEEFSDVAGLRLSVPLPLFRRNQGEIQEQQALVARAGVAERQARLRVALEVKAAHAAWTRARALARQISPDLERRLADDARALREAYERGTMPLVTALASLREVFGARRTVADGRAEATLATLGLLTAAGAAVAPEVSP